MSLHPGARIHPPPPVHPSLGHVIHDEDDDEDDDELGVVDQHSGSRESRPVRKRSSKACDNCRKAKCKCEKSADSVACRNCVLLAQECTFLGPSRKRGPPKGYIDAIEARLHQLEALLGTIIASPDPRAQSLVADLISDPLARHIIARVDESPFGSRAREQDPAKDPKARTHINTARTAILNGRVGFDVPPRDWQDELGARILGTAISTPVSANPSGSSALPGQNYTRHSRTPSSTAHRSPPLDTDRPLRRRLSSSGSTSPVHPTNQSHANQDDTDAEEPDTLTDALGQLSLNEHQQLRYHGKASGLHILAQAPAYRTDRVRMDDDGIWRFPSSRVWPPVAEEGNTDEEPSLEHDSPSVGGAASKALGGTEAEVEQFAQSVLPPRAQQERLLRLYFTYVHPVLPVVHQGAFWRDWEASAQPDAPPSTRIPTLLLLSIYAVAARYDARPARPSRAGTMWAAGDRYLEAAKVLLNRSYASSKASTCQALLLLSYREIGIGAMAQAWLYVGMSVRMAQDLGLHRSIDKWQAAGAKTFTPAEKQTRRCIWFGCVVMDKYVSTYIGRPLAVFERDYDTRWPDYGQEAEGEGGGEGDVWVDLLREEKVGKVGKYEPLPGRVLECFSAASKLSAILSHIVEALYSIRPLSARSSERARLEEQLEKWLLDLPVYLRYDVSRCVLEGSGKVPPPHVLTLHMMYWCSVLLLHRPSIRFTPPPSHRHASPEGSTTSDTSTSAASARAIGLCRSAANHITRIVCAYGADFSLERGPAFLSYYVFSASIMHVTLLMMNPEDVQAQMGLQQCMSALETMNMTWPSAGRAHELLNESKMNIQAHYLETLRRSPWRSKRKTTDEEVEEDGPGRDRVASEGTLRLGNGTGEMMRGGELARNGSELARSGSEADIRTMMRDGGVQLAPMREGRAIAGTGRLAHARDATLPGAGHAPSPGPGAHPNAHSIAGAHSNGPRQAGPNSHPEAQLKQHGHSRPVHSPAPALARTTRHVQSLNQNYAPLPQSAYPQQPVESMFQDPGYPRWGSEVPSYTAQDPQYFGNPNGSWDGHIQQQQHGQGWRNTSAARFSVDDGSGRGASNSGPNGGSAGGYWQDYQPAAFGNDMAGSLYGIMPPVGHVPGGVGMQSMFQEAPAGVYENPDGPGGISPSYPVYSRLS